MTLAFGLATVSMWCVASLGLLFSSLVENAIGPIVGTMAVIIVLLVLSNMPVEFFRNIRPYFFTSYLNVWQEVFDEPIAWREIWSDLAVVAGHCVGFYLVTWYIFVKKDILS
jgi:ABC-2 type transport system permease protein